MKKRYLVTLACILTAALAAGCGSAKTNSGNGGPGDGMTAQEAQTPEVAGDGLGNADGAGNGSGNGTAKGANNGTEGSASRQVVAYVGQDLFDGNYDPLMSDVYSRGYMLFHSGLLKIDSSSNVQPDLATDYSISGDGLTYTFTLRQDAMFSDGERLTAEDVAFTYNKAKELASPGIDLTRMIKASAPDEATVEVTLSEPSSNFLVTAAQLGIVPEHAYGDGYGATGIGSGPWKYVQLDVDQQLIVEPNEYYYGQKPALDRVTFLKLDNDAALAAAKSGQLDIVMVSPEYALEEVEGMHLERLKTMDIRNINLPVVPAGEMDGVAVGNDFTCDPSVRKAIAIGLDRQKVIDQALNGIGKPAYGLSTNLPWAKTVDYADGQVEEAVKLLEEAGWKDTDGDGIREKDGVKAEFAVDTASNEMDRYNVAMAVSEQMRALGINMTVNTVTWDDIEQFGHSDGVVWGWGSFNPDLVYSLYSEHALDPAGSPYSNNAVYVNETTDSYIDQALSATTDKEANELWKMAQDDGKQGPNYDYPYLFIVNIEHCYFVKDGLNIHTETQIPHPHGHGLPVICNMNQWEWK